MNIVNKLTARHLKENKGRSVVTAFGIIVSVAMITAVFVAIASFMNLFSDVTVLARGDYIAKIYGADESYVQQLRDDERVSTVGIQVGDYRQYKLDNAKSERFGTGSILAANDDALKMYIRTDYDGTLPANENEIAVEQDLIDKNNLGWKIGDTVSIPYGDRLINDENGNEVPAVGTYTEGESFRLEGIGKYKITAILHNNAPTQSYSIVCGLSGIPEDNFVTSFQLKKLDYRTKDVVDEILKTSNGTETDINNDLLDCYFSFAKGSTSAMLLPMVIIVLAIIMVASVVLIYNAFAMSLAEKVKYLGMLSSVGATKRQKKLSIYYEGFLLGLIGLPVGIGAGILGIGITLKLLGERIISTGMLMGVSDSNVSMKIVVSPWVLAGIIVISTLTIFISCAIPAKKASDITPIMALRQTNEIKLKSRNLRSPKIVKLLFGYEGELAHKNLKRNGRKARVITVSIALSVILFLSCNYFCDMFMRAADVETMPYQVGCYLDNKDYDNRDTILKKINGIDGVDDAYCITNSIIIINSDSVDDKLKDVFNKDNFNGVFSGQLEHNNTLFINFVDDDMFNDLCKANGIDYTRYYQGDCKGLMLNNLNHRQGTSPVMKDTVLGKKIADINTEKMTDITITDFVKYDSKDRLCNMNPTDSFSVYVPFSVYSRFDDSTVYCLGITTKQHEQVSESLQSLCDSGELPESMRHVDYEQQTQLSNTLVLILQVFVYGFIALISLITVFNIINTISSGIASRRKEFAMLKSVGTTPAGFNKMIMLESAFYGMRALIVSIPLSVLISKGMNMVIAEAAIPFELNWITYLVVVAVVFVVIGATMLFSVKQVQKENIIETLKEEIN